MPRRKWRYSIHQIRAGNPQPVDAIAQHDASIDAAEELARQTGRCIYDIPAQEVA